MLARLLVLLLLIGAAFVGHARAAGEPSPPITDSDAVLRYSQSAIGRSLGDYSFLNAMRQPRNLAAYRGKPLVVNLIYTACDASCPITVLALGDAIEAADELLGADRFNVVTIGFDAKNDTPERMRAYADNAKLGAPNWEFLSGDPVTIDRLIHELGFVIAEEAGGYEHVAQTTVVDSKGRIFQHVYGANFEPPALVEPLKALALSGDATPPGFAGLLDQVRLFCTSYDSATGRYHLNYGTLIGILIGALSLMAVLFLLVRAALRVYRSSDAPREPV
jgi:protein SCO1/2